MFQQKEEQENYPQITVTQMEADHRIRIRL